jgi:isopropylmalate/homocitrate/citramalate synthase
MQHTSDSSAVPLAQDYFPDQFPEDRFPSFGWIQRPTSFPAEVWTTETTHRDGQQGGLPLTTEQSVRIYDLLCRFTGRSGAIRQAEYFVYRKSDLDGFTAAQERYAAGAPIEPTTWIRATVKDVKQIQSLGVKESGFLASISDYHVFHKFNPGGRLQAAMPSDLEFHPHNDTGLIVANSLAAVRHGCAAINGTCLGKGERTGNAPLELILLHLIGMGYYAGCQPDFTVLNELGELYAEMGQPVADKSPLYGRDAHRTRAGIHADGLNKFWWMYAPFDVPKLIGRPLEVSLTKDSGIAGLIFVARQHLHREFRKDDPKIQAAHEWMLRQFDEGRQTAVEWDEIANFLLLV